MPYQFWLFYNDLQSCRAMHHWDYFVIPRQLLKTSPVADGSDILRLPNEILLLIFSYVGAIGEIGEIYKLFLALTCRRFLGIASMGTLIVPSGTKHRVHGTSCCPGLLSFLHIVGPRDARGNPKKSLGLCCDCYRFRPRRRSYWKHVRKNFPSEKECSCLVAYGDRVESWSSNYSYQCPECWCVERGTAHRQLQGPRQDRSPVQHCFCWDGESIKGVK